MMARFPFRISVIRPEGTPSANATLFALNPRASSSLLRFCPDGWVTSSFPSFLSPVIIGYFNIVGIPVFPLKADTPRAVDRDGPLTLSVPLQTMKVDTPEWRNVGQPGSGIEYVKSLESQLYVHTPETGGFALLIQLCRCSIRISLESIRAIDFVPLHEVGVQDMIKYLECGDYTAGFAQVRCSDCGREYSLAFSCKGRHLGRAAPICRGMLCSPFTGGIYLEQLAFSYFRQLAALIQAGPPRAEFKGRVVKYLVVQKRTSLIGPDINRCRKGLNAGLRFKTGWGRR